MCRERFSGWDFCWFLTTLRSRPACRARPSRHPNRPVSLLVGCVRVCARDCVLMVVGYSQVVLVCPPEIMAKVIAAINGAAPPTAPS